MKTLLKCLSALIIIAAGVLSLRKNPLKSDTITEKSIITVRYTTPYLNTQNTEEKFSGVVEHLQYSSNVAQVFNTLLGAKKWESKTALLTDPLSLHDDSLIQKIPTMLLTQINTDTTVWTVVTLDNTTYTITSIINEEGVEKAVLDPNPAYTIQEQNWTFTVETLQ